MGTINSKFIEIQPCLLKKWLLLLLILLLLSVWVFLESMFLWVLGYTCLLQWGTDDWRICLELLLLWSLAASHWFVIRSLWIRWGRGTMLVMLPHNSWLDISYFISLVLSSFWMTLALASYSCYLFWGSWGICQNIVWVLLLLRTRTMIWIRPVVEVRGTVAVCSCWMWV